MKNDFSCTIYTVAAMVSIGLQHLYPVKDGMLIAVTFAILAVAWRRG